ncbi:MAG TPA: glycerate kinase [Roseiflexaceae bacterium]|nr:glycerate kinase [Roseiflexaceae bacterium]
MITPDRLMTESLRAAPWGAVVAQVLAAALRAVEPGAAVRRFVRRDGDTLLVNGHPYDLRRFERVLLVGAGKAGAPMARTAAELLGPDLTAGIVVVKQGHQDPASSDEESAQLNTQHSKLRTLEAGHPVPDTRGVAGAHQIAELLKGATERDLVLVLISGGGSALLTLPATGVTLEDIQRLTEQLLGCGASINEINALRKHLDLVKGGGLARLAHPATVVTLVLSDVVGSPLDVIASGPTVPDRSSFAETWAVLERYRLTERAPASILERLRRGLDGGLPENPGPDDPVFARVTNLLVGNNPLAAEAALAAAREAGLETMLLTTFLQGEAREAGRLLAAVAREIAASGRPLRRPACMIAGGETTVTLRGDGRGGRNQELALAAAADLGGLADVALVALATDGGDGPTDAAGAVATGATLERARAQGLDVAAHLARNDAYPFFAALGDLLLPGPTQTNVNDLVFVFVW